jgi:hypothetical protein
MPGSTPGLAGKWNYLAYRFGFLPSIILCVLDIKRKKIQIKYPYPIKRNRLRSRFQYVFLDDLTGMIIQ